ncbi:MAG: HlyC/CorC family transporter [Alphaproteobacteria bacterium]|nr:HlyC/CorC family transporter [Alphaproteobacteria bacterium]
MNSNIVDILLAVFLLAANAFFVAAEFALVKSRGFRIDALAEQNRLGARMVQNILRNIEAHLACCQLGITMASLGLGWVGEPTVAALLRPALGGLDMPEPALHVTSFAVGFLVFSSLHIVVGEQVPKTLAIREPEPVALWIAYPLRASFLLFYPLNWLLNTAARSILTLIGVKETPHHDILTDDEIEGLVEVSAEHGKVGTGQAEYIHNVFRFGDLKIADVMRHRTNMESFDIDMPRRALVKAILASRHSRIPLWRGESENIVRVLQVKNLAQALADANGDVDALDMAALTTDPWFVPDTTRLEDQIHAFRKHHARFALVVDEYGALQGLVTLEDIIEEIMGRIPERADVLPDVRRRPDGSYLVEGTVPVRDLNRELQWDLPEEEATTIAGLVIAQSGTIPEVGQRFAYFGFVFEIMRRQRNQITALRIIPPATPAASWPQ